MSELPANVDSRLGRLGTLPGELRNQIYELALTADGPIAFEGLQTQEGKIQVRPRDAARLHTFRALCLTSSLLAAEARPLFFKVNRFEVALGEYEEEDWETQLPLWNIFARAERRRLAFKLPPRQTLTHAKTFAKFYLPHIEDLVIKNTLKETWGVRARVSTGSGVVVTWFGFEEIEGEGSGPVGVEVADDAKMDDKLVAKIWKRVQAEPPPLTAQQ